MFITGAYPRGGTYNPTQTKFITSNYSDILIFDSQKYTLLATVPINNNGYEVMSVKVSLDGMIGYAYFSSLVPFDTSVLMWFNMPF